MSDGKQVWEVVAGAEQGGILVREGCDLSSALDARRLSPNALVAELELRDHRVRFQLLAGRGPETGWASVRSGEHELMVRTAKQACHYRDPPSADSMAIGGSNRLVQQEAPVQKRRGQTQKALGDLSFAQVAEKPYTYYHQIRFAETKRTGLRMSACLAVMDELRTELLGICDDSVASFRKVSNPQTDVSIELRPAVQRLAGYLASDGLLMADPAGKGPVLSWLRAEAEMGWPMFPLRTEEQNLYLVGKDKNSQRREPLARGRFVQATVDDDAGKALFGENWERDFDQFYARLRRDHSNSRLDERRLQNLYDREGKAFAPTHFQKVSWLMSPNYSDLWSILYHAKVPELLWEVNMKAGGPFAGLLEADADPQAIAVSLPTKMLCETVYTVCCFVDAHSQKAVYILLPEGSTEPGKVALSVCARYDWAGTPEDGKTLTAEDAEVAGAQGRTSLLAYAMTQEKKSGKLVDFSGLP